MNNTKISEMQVLRSAAGFYIGRTDEDGFPYSRESGYYHTHDEAADALENNTYAPRMWV